MRKITAILFAAACACIATTAVAQNNVGIWGSVGASTKLNKQWKVSADLEYRTPNLFASTERMGVGVALSYKNKAFPYIKADVGYSFLYCNNPAKTSIKYQYDADGKPIMGTLPDGTSIHRPSHKNIDEAYWGSRHRGTFSVTGSYTVGRVKLALRERYQLTYRMPASCDRVRLTYNEPHELYPDFPEFVETDESRYVDSKKGRLDHKLRSRLSVTYDIPKCKFEPFVEAEVYNRLDNAFNLDKVRYTVGTDYKINKKNKVSLYYRYQDHPDEDGEGGHIIGLGYSIDI